LSIDKKTFRKMLIPSRLQISTEESTLTFQGLFGAVQPARGAGRGGKVIQRE
jgi:hypothetical protein